VPALQAVPFMTNINDYRQFIHLFLNTYHSPIKGENTIRPAWKDIKLNLLQDARFGTIIHQADNDETLSKTANEWIKGLNTPQEKAYKIIELIKENVEWSGKNSIYSQYNTNQLLERKIGNSAEINLMLLACLKKAGIQALPVLVSTREHGKPQPNFPYLHQFDFVVIQAEIDGKKQLLDATPKYLSSSRISKSALNGQGLLIDKNDQTTWINIPAPKNRAWHDVEFYIQADGTVKGKLKTIHTDYSAARLQKSLNDSGDKNTFIQKFMADLPVQVTKSQITNIPNKTLKMDIEFESNQLITKKDDELIFQPFILSSKPKKPLKALTRDFETDFGYQVSENVLIKIYLPNGYTLNEKPKGIKAKLLENSGNYSLTSGYEPIKGEWYLRSQLNLTKSKFSSNEYTYLQEFLTMVFNKQQVQLTFKKEHE
jgi:hypothetical protein